MMQWDEDLADIIEELIRLANCNQTPTTEAEWKDICERFGVDLYLVRSRSRHAGVVLDDVIVVKRALQPEQTHQRIVHELSEFLLCSEWHPPVLVPIGSLDEQRHHIACLMEQKLREMQIAHRRTAEQQIQAIAQRRMTLERQQQALARKMQQIQSQIALEDNRIREIEMQLEF